MNSLKDLIKVKIQLPDSVFTGNRTYSSLFLGPLFGLDLSTDIYYYIVNLYLDDERFEHRYKRPLFLLLDTKQFDEPYREIDTNLKNNKNFVYSYVVGSADNMFLVMYVFECPDESIPDYDKFLSGQYSKFSSKLKSRFNKLAPDGKGGYEESPLYGVLFKTKTWKKKVEQQIDSTLDPSQEYFGTPNMDLEIFKYE